MSIDSVQTLHLANVADTQGLSGAQKAQAADSKPQSHCDKHSRTVELCQQTSLSISIHKETGAIVIRVVHQSTGEVIREIPPEQVLNGLRYIILDPSGLLLNRQA